MDFAFTEDQLSIKDSVGKLCARLRVRRPLARSIQYHDCSS